MDEENKCIRLANGVQMPSLGIGTFGGYSNEAMIHALKHCNIRHIDTARFYKNEHLVAKSIMDSGVSREELFITSKVWPSDYGYEKTRAAFQDSLKQAAVEYFDQYLLHWPNSPQGTNTKQLIRESWKALEEFYSQGLCKSIGVSNFEISDLEDLKEIWSVVPHVNQLEVHIFSFPAKLIQYCRDLGMQIVAYSPIARGQALVHPKVLELASKYSRQASQIANRWIIQHGIVTIPKSANSSRVEENAKIFDFALSDEDMRSLDAVHEKDHRSIIKKPISPTFFNQM